MAIDVVGGLTMPREAGVLLKREGDLILVCDAEGRPLPGQKAVETRNAVNEVMTVTATFYVTGWVE